MLDDAKRKIKWVVRETEDRIGRRKERMFVEKVTVDTEGMEDGECRRWFPSAVVGAQGYFEVVDAGSSCLRLWFIWPLIDAGVE
jgi:hypothetical protein